MNRSSQTSLFDTAEETASSASRVVTSSALEVTAQGTRPLSRWQREFNTLSASVSELREALVAAKELLDDYQSHVAKVYDPSWRTLQDVRRAWAIAADRVLGLQASWPKAQRLTRKRQRHLATFLIVFVDDLLDQTDDDEELVAIHDRHSGITHEESKTLERQVMQSFIEKMVGEDVMQGHDAQDVEGLLRHAQEQLQARLQADAEQRAAKSKARPTKAALAREQAAKDVSRSVRDVYRKLASSLHPDREADPAERERKTRLMQSANRAYEQGDLLQLLSMQISLLQDDATTLAQADDARLKTYCAALREQQGVLKREIAEREAPMRHIFEMGPRGSLPGRSAVLSKVDHDTRRLKQGISGMREDIAHLLDPRTCAAVVDALELPGDDIPGFDEIESFAMQAAFAAPTGKKRRR